MPIERPTALEFPGKGLDVSTEYQGQPPGTTADAANVRTQDPLAEQFRGGSRPGLSRLAASALPGPVQELSVVVVTQTPSVNTDFQASDPLSFPSLNPAATLGVDYVVDASTNNNAAGLGPRNPGTGRTIRKGGSGRPEYRPPVEEGPYCRTYHVAAGFEEGWRDFTICTDTVFPYTFTSFAVIGSWAGSALVAPGPAPPTIAELTAIIDAAGGTGAPFDSYTDVAE